ncbi:uncharacterized protein [Fopius arisanus]|uniref:Uncharacterized protein n=1 Tax=Fopius arisanus TaxID=64838 RepID=A0A9R1TSZ7_9HYME|nr:PREDICTED: uncharacterized protein LOC105273604 [Fopius arisanus]
MGLSWESRALRRTLHPPQTVDRVIVRSVSQYPLCTDPGLDCNHPGNESLTLVRNLSGQYPIYQHNVRYNVHSPHVKQNNSSSINLTNDLIGTTDLRIPFFSLIHRKFICIVLFVQDITYLKY